VFYFPDKQGHGVCVRFHKLEAPRTGPFYRSFDVVNSRTMGGLGSHAEFILVDSVSGICPGRGWAVLRS